jgi:hypothetical protein
MEGMVIRPVLNIKNDKCSGMLTHMYYYQHAQHLSTLFPIFKKKHHAGNLLIVVFLLNISDNGKSHCE